MPAKHLHLITLMPPETIRTAIRSFKKEMNSRFGAKHALKLPAHITLQRPFWMLEEHGESVERSLEEFAQKQMLFPVHLKGFDCFRPRVIYVRIPNPEPIVQLQLRLQQALPSEIFLKEQERQHNPIHPHMTVATRDLKQKDFHRAWKTFQCREYEAGFTADRLVLFRHDGKLWSIKKQFLFKD